MGVTEERTSMGDESKKKAILPSIKVIGLFYVRCLYLNPAISADLD